MTPTIDTGRAFTRRSVLKIGGGVVGGIGIGTLLAACGDAGTKAAGATGNITWGAQAFFSTQSTNSDVAAYVKKALADFEKKSGAKVALTVQSSDNSAGMAKLLQQASQGRASDAAMVDSYIFPQFEKYAKDIELYAGPAGVTIDDFFPFFQPLVGKGSSVVGLPIHTDVRMLYYRKDLVSTPPTSWDELVRISKPLAAKGQYFMFPAGRSEDPLMCSIWPWYWAQAAEIVDSKGAVGFSSGSGYDAMMNTLGFIKRCIDEGITPTRASTFMVSDDMLPDIIGGRVAMFVGGSWMATNMQNQMGGDVTQKWAVAPIPSMNGVDFATSAGGWMYGCFATEKKSLKNAADFVIDTYIAKDAMAQFCTAAGYLPARQSVYQSSAFKGGPFTPEFRDSLAKHAKSRPGVAKYAAISTAMQIAMSSVASKAATPKKALDTALATL